MEVEIGVPFDGDMARAEMGEAGASRDCSASWMTGDWVDGMVACRDGGFSWDWV